MRFVVSLLWLASALSCGRIVPRNPEPALPWQIGYWYWRSAQPMRAEGVRVDCLYVDAGSPHAPLWPRSLPEAATYTAVWRLGPGRFLSPALIREIAAAYANLKATAVSRGQHVSGLQIDFDCPAVKLPEYAQFVRALRQSVPKREVISVTALLDWFRPGTGVERLLEQVDEFVPQFYDVEPDATVVWKLEAERWRPVLERSGVAYRLGIATFGRIMRMRGKQRRFLRDLRPLDLIVNMCEPQGEFRSDVGERIVRLRAKRAFGTAVAAGDDLLMVIPTQEALSASVAEARKFGPHCAGVVLFRWPSAADTLVLAPDEIAAIVEGNDAPPREPRLSAEPGDCGRLQCSDLFLAPALRFAPEAHGFEVRASVPLVSFIPDPTVEWRSGGSDTFSVRIPAYAGVRRIHLGRAITKEPVQFQVSSR